MKIAIVVGEASGDQLGAGLVRELKRKYPAATFEGIAGPLMCEEGCDALFPMEKLAVMGVTEVLKHLPELLKIRKALFQRWQQSPPDVFIGIDAPDFNLGLETSLKKLGIKTAHYVSPSVWAWRESRIHTIVKACDLMLTLFPFETAIYHKYGLPVECVGHPQADRLPLVPDKNAMRVKLGLDPDKPIVAILPGSRSLEVDKLGQLFLQTAVWCLSEKPDLQFVMVASSAKRYDQLTQILQQYPDLPVTLTTGNAQQVLMASDAVLVASGTATLEALFAKCPMVMAYRVSWLTYWLVKPFLRTKYFALPNLLAERLLEAEHAPLIPEFIQKAATVKALGTSLLEYFTDTDKTIVLQQQFTEIHKLLKLGADKMAAQAISKHLLEVIT